MDDGTALEVAAKAVYAARDHSDQRPTLKDALLVRRQAQAALLAFLNHPRVRDAVEFECDAVSAHWVFKKLKALAQPRETP